MSGFRTFVGMVAVMLFSICKADEADVGNLEKYFFDIKFTVSFEKNSQNLPSDMRSDIVNFFLRNGINKNDIHFNRATVLHTKGDLERAKIVEMVRIESNDLNSLKLTLNKFKLSNSYSKTDISEIKKKLKAVL